MRRGATLIDIRTDRQIENDRTIAQTVVIPGNTYALSQRRARMGVDHVGGRGRPCRDAPLSDPASRSPSRSSKLKASAIRSPERHSTATSAWLRIPVGARAEHALISAIASNSVRT